LPTCARTVDDVDVCLRNGTSVVIRPIRPDDKALLVRGMAALSPRSARLRFLAPKNRFSLAELRYLTEVDHVDHYALVAVLADDPTTMAGVGRWVRDREHPDAAEVAVVVGDCYQRQGLGTALGNALADGARALGIARFNAVMLPENTAAQRLFAHISGRLSTRLQGGTYELVADLAA
jgi:RimJ/RimL family protein N-acetyltransferase